MENVECPVSSCEHEASLIGRHLSSKHDESEIRAVLIEEIKSLEEECGKVPTIRMMNESGKFSQSMYDSYFDSWNSAVKSADLETTNEYRNDDELLRELKSVAERIDETPTQRQLREFSDIDPSIIVKRLGWNNALKKAGLEINKIHKIKKSELISEIQRVASIIGKPPKRDELEEHSEYSWSVFVKRFGSYNDAIREAGFEPENLRKVPRDELIKELNRISDELGRPPSANKYRALETKFSLGPYITEFGTWNEALGVSGLEPVKRGMSGMEQAVYTLRCSDNNYYVGVSAYPERRLEEHKRGGRDAAKWTAKHDVEEVIEITEKMSHDMAYEKEREKTIKLMREKGWKNVRGGPWLSVDLQKPPEDL
jgi:predicted GIY-YIG superfamily endonuclease